MELFQTLLLLCFWAIMVLGLRSLTTLFHELGHAIPSLLFTSAPVQVYIGTYGDTSNCLRVHLGRLSLYFRFNFLAWNIGMCQHRGTISLWKKILITLGGPLASTVIALPLIYLLSQYECSNTWIHILLIFIIAAGIDLLVNLIPIQNQMDMHDGSIAYNDGYLLYLYFSRFFLSENYLVLEEAYEAKDFNRFFPKAIELVESGNAQRSIYDLLAHAYIQEKAWDDALIVYEKMNARFKLSPKDYLELAEIYKPLGQYEQAIKCLDAYSYQHFENIAPILDKATLQIQLEAYDEAILTCNTIINSNPENTRAIAIRGLAFAKSGLFQNAKEDLEHLKKEANQNEVILGYIQEIESISERKK